MKTIIALILGMLWLPLVANAQDFHGTISYDKASKSITLRGNTTEEQEGKFRQLVNTEEVKYVIISGPGGLMYSGIGIGRLIHMKGLEVVVDGQCVSACAMIWMSAKKGHIISDGAVFLHQPYIPMMPTTITIQEYTDFAVKGVLDFSYFLQDLGYAQRLAFYLMSATSHCEFVQIKDWETIERMKKSLVALPTVDWCWYER